MTTANKRAKQDLKAQFFSSATVSGKPGVYFIGPFGRRVSFASQQRRALNVVWALGKDVDLDARQRIAVVGGGIAGLTVCAALIAKGCQVVLFEKEETVLKQQMQTQHRYVHPTINFWPEKELNDSTELPYFDWHEGTCAEAVGYIDKEWREYFQAGLVGKHFQTEVTSMTCADGKVKLEYVKTKAREVLPPSSEVFNCVFITTGFGSERLLLSDDKSYWAPDYLEDSIEPGDSFIVGGTGDGGLIESLRISQSNFAKGRLALEVARLLTSTSRDRLVSKIEQDVWKETTTDDGAADAYFAEYTNLIGAFPDELKSKLDTRRKDITVGLVGTLKQPFGKYVAPVHKVMMAYALKEKAITYQVGKLIAEANVPFVKKKSSKKAIPAKVRVISRIGPEHPLGKFLTEAEIKPLMDSQRSQGDFLDPAPIDLDFFPGYLKFPKRDLGCPKFARLRKEQIDNYLFNRFGVKTKIVPSDKLFAFEMVTEASIPEDDEYTVPKSMFGFAISQTKSNAEHL